MKSSVEHLSPADADGPSAHVHNSVLAQIPRCLDSQTESRRFESCPLRRRSLGYLHSEGSSRVSSRPSGLSDDELRTNDPRTAQVLGDRAVQRRVGRPPISHSPLSLKLCWRSLVGESALHVGTVMLDQEPGKLFSASGCRVRTWDRSRLDNR